MSDCYITAADYRQYWAKRALTLVKGWAIDVIRDVNHMDPCQHCGEFCFLDVPCHETRKDDAR
jgi:hypothetical protein